MCYSNRHRLSSLQPHSFSCKRTFCLPYSKMHHYIYRKFTVNFFDMDIHSFSRRATSSNFKEFSPHVLGLVLTYHMNCRMSIRQTAQAMWDIHIVKISHTTVANYAMTASAVIKHFVDSYDYKHSNILAADETYIKKRGITGNQSTNGRYLSY